LLAFRLVHLLVLSRSFFQKSNRIAISGEDVTKNKPAPDIYLAAAKILQVKEFECVAIEDSPAGICAAKSAGIFCIGFKNPLYNLDLRAANLITNDLTRIDFTNI
jgi:HAD superfamily hydrolase (TIGR01509 family)